MSAEQEVVELEKRYWQAIKDRDVATIRRLSDDPCLLTGAQGVGVLTREALGQMMEDARWMLHDFRIEDVSVRILADGVAAVAYRVHEDLTVEGERVSLVAADASAWVRRGGQWACALHSESIAGDPFGRGRRFAAR